MAPLEEDNPLDLSVLNHFQQNALNELKQRFSKQAESGREFLQDEHYLIHWLKARKFCVSAAESMLLNHLRFRDALKMDSPEYSDYKVDPVMARYYTRGRFGFTKRGHPIVYFPFGGIDAKGLIHSTRLSDALRAIMFWQEERRKSCIDASKQLGKRIQQVVYIFDLRGIGARHLWPIGLEVFQQMAKLVEQHTPEIIYKVKVINAPTLFHAIFKMVKPILDENTLRKVQIFGTEGWKEALLEEIDKDQLPVHYGGTAVGIDGDIKCEHAIRYGGEIPRELYFTEKEKKKLLRNIKLFSLILPHGQKSPFYYNIQKPGSVIFWYFESRNYLDVGFAVYRIPDELATVPAKSSCGTEVHGPENYEMVYPYFRLVTHIVPEWGHIVVERPGMYLVLFDNSYSWMYNKSIKYFISVEDKDSEMLASLPLSETIQGLKSRENAELS